ncbi:MAG: NUDIX domain-containing protein [Oscillospiraceae bacterium]|nr:NUDIX domain-containing protein [Oscillospiraceae bacterium]
MKTEKSCGAVVFRKGEKETQILLIKHMNGGHWAFPKGHMEKGETEEETALREILEETGLAVTLDTNYRKVVTYSPRRDVVKDVVYFVAVAQSDKAVAQEGEISQVKWVEMQSAVEHVSYENDKTVLLGAIEHYLNNNR